MKKSFKDCPAGIFRADNGLCYTKFEKPVTVEGETFNAVVITTGTLRNFEDASIVDDLREG